MIELAETFDIPAVGCAHWEATAKLMSSVLTPDALSNLNRVGLTKSSGAEGSDLTIDPARHTY